MSTKHFIHAAKLISSIQNIEQKQAAARVFAMVAEYDNQRFNRAKFFKACGLNENGK